ncbi:isopenicillin N synthase family oxygenase [Ruegeria sp. Ofav3-42]|uniref:isopenicillin N synthase family dioxygenase n=1 Tax=Ruegeria sp. Ofav3-42 TaxID=2917759 RepID=UPI001EF716DD|nr:2-oxoglutarate and iron-dependent oxygenase domain-containing protein [Ruegeria sp. Ofav3-42]MCG7518463.1 isopenicillin N synthase family oxygenase [Ruegeria sp. Ofav3-42]
MIDDLDLKKLDNQDKAELRKLLHAVGEVGFLTVSNTGLTGDQVRHVIAAYHDFFHLPVAEKQIVDMAATGSNRGWGAPQSEQVDPAANPDFKEVFDCGFELPENNAYADKGLSVYAPNLWPKNPQGFQSTIREYYSDACAVAMRVLRAIAVTLGRDETSFDRAFDTPMALLRGNFYPQRPTWAGDRDFGIGAHTDYGCLTLLATDGSSGLEVRMPDNSWQPVSADPGTFIINFGEMLEFWTSGQVKATQHRVIGGAQERISVPLFFNPSYDTNVAPPQSGKTISAGQHLTRRYNETYVHLQAT